MLRGQTQKLVFMAKANQSQTYEKKISFSAVINIRCRVDEFHKYPLCANRDTTFTKKKIMLRLIITFTAKSPTWFTEDDFSGRLGVEHASYNNFQKCQQVFSQPL